MRIVSSSYLILIFAGILGLAAVWMVRRLAVRLGLVQNANARSSHSGQKPTGGGLGVVLTAAITGIVIAIMSDIALLIPVSVAIGLGLVGLLDDRRHLSMRARLLAQFLAVILSLVYFMFFHDLAISLGAIGPLWLLGPLLVIWGVLWINLFNFMDGIDGLAVSEVIFVLGAMLILAFGFQPWALTGQWLWLACVLVAALAFLVFNWSPAKIFMGDAGSYFFAIIMFLAALWGLVSGNISPFASFILIAVFVADSSVALVRRFITGQNWKAGHRTHTYQYLSRRFSHARTTIFYMGLNLIWLLPLAFCAQWLLINPFLCVVLAYVPLVALATWGKSGQPEAR